MVRPVPKEVEQLEGEEITCPLCRSEEVEIGTTKSDALQGFCAIQRSPFFLNEPGRLDPDLLPDKLRDDEESQDDDSEELEQNSQDSQDSKPWRGDDSGEEPADDSDEIGTEDLNQGGESDNGTEKSVWEL